MTQPPDRKPVLTGGCQCGNIRYALYAMPTNMSVCYCRMCQKAMGGPYAALVPNQPADFSWTRGQPGTFTSSNIAARDFCRDCGTPLTYRNLLVDRTSVSSATLDQPYAYVPQAQYGIENRPHFAAALAGLREVPMSTYVTPGNEARFASRQHPDHDTDRWPRGA